jgi:hypothetical protein
VTGSTLIYDALRDLGVLRAGQTAAPETIADALRTLNQIVGTWNTERLIVASIVREEVALTGGVSEYQLATRPTRIERAGYIVTGGTVADEYPVDVLNTQQYAEGRNGLYNDTATPDSTLTVRPTPETADTAVLYVWRQLAAFDLDTDVTLAPGYEIALRFALALTLAPSMLAHAKLSPLLADIRDRARTAKAAIKSANITPRYLRADSALLRTSYGGYGY